MSRILLVEDHDSMRDIMSRWLMSKGYEVTMAVDGEEAISTAHSDMPDLILMDLRLPRTTGWEATRRLKADVETRQIPIVAISANAMDSYRNRALEIGFDGFSGKPPDFEQLHELIEALLRPTLPAVR